MYNNKAKMEIFRNKKADEKIGMPLREIIGWIILIILIIFAAIWMPSLANKSIKIINELFK